MDYAMLFKRKELSDALAASIGSINVAKKKENASTATYTSVIDKLGE